MLRWLIRTKHFPDSKTLPRIQNRSRNPKHIPESGFCKVFLNSGKCFGFWEVFFGFWEVFCILGSVFGFWEGFLNSGTCFGFWEVFLDSRKCFGIWEVFWPYEPPYNAIA